MKTNSFIENQAPNQSQRPKASVRKVQPWLVAAALILLSAIPVAGGAFRLSELAGGAEITPANARFFESPLPVVLHIVSASLFALLGAFQFVNRLWQRGTGWHR